MTDGRPVVLTLCDYFLPGYKAGGPIRTLTGIIEHLQDEFQFKVATRDRDLGDAEPYQRVPVNTWHDIGAGQVIHLSPSRLGASAIRRLISSTRHDLLYLNSCFSVPFAMVPLVLRRSGLIQPRPVILAVRGELAPGALAIHGWRKRLYMTAAKNLELTRKVVWQASGEHEARDIQRWFGVQSTVIIAPDLSPAYSHPARRVSKDAGRLRLLFLARISPMKNLEGALTMLKDFPDAVEFSIYGPIEDPAYWKRCERLLAELPGNVSARYLGAVRPDDIQDVMAAHDLLFLPTMGENFGHVILEALSGGCPVLISNRTSWRSLEEIGVGWDVPLEDPGRFNRILRHCVAMDAGEWALLSERARSYGTERLADEGSRDQNRALFRAASGMQQSTA